jgi:diguanylate cyclase (GGDEF)-like protein
VPGSGNEPQVAWVPAPAGDASTQNRRQRLLAAAGDFVPLKERLAMLRWFRLLAAAVVVVAWLALPQARGARAALLFGVTGAYVVATLMVEVGWRASGRRATWIFGVVVMADAVYLAWVSYATNGLGTPLEALLLLQLVTVSLLASFRTGVKLALFSSLLLLCAYYAQQAGALQSLGGRPTGLGKHDYALVCAEMAVFWLAALITATFAAVNERELRRRRYDLAALAELARHLEALHEPRDIAARLLGDVREAFDCDRSLLLMADDRAVRCLATRDVDDAAEVAWPLASAELAERAPRVAAVMADGTTALLKTEERETDVVLAAFGPRRQLMVIPLRSGGRSVGALVAEHSLRKGSRVERRVVTMLESFTSHTELVLEKARLMQEVSKLATIDALTGLPNRRLLDESLTRSCAEALRTGAPLSVLMIDIDHFKRHNDTFGHQSGDELLRKVGATLRDNCRAMDMAARFGGEEFCLVMPGTDIVTAAGVAERVRRAIAEIAAEQPVSASVGVACAPDQGRTPADIARAADEALYAAKNQGRNRVVVAGGIAPQPRAA